jgi:filamentous hemagglutinin family protein
MNKHFFLFLATALSLLPNITQAQTYTPSNRPPQQDNSIGTIVNPTGANNFNITGGLQRGQNLFHSFTDFSIPTGGTANFINPQQTQSIISRVTGNLFSDINGTLNTNGANFLLINPHGVVFGPGVSLNVGKSFVTSTASGVDFVDAQGQNYNFGVNQVGDRLLSIAPGVTFNPARLVMNASIPGSKGIENYGTLQTQNSGQYIGLIGGAVNFNGGQIKAPGGRVELGGLTGPGTVGVQGNLFGAQFLTNVARGDVSLTNGSRVNVAGSGGGDIAITARNLEILSRSVVSGGIEHGLGTPASVAGDIKLDATGRVIISNNGGIVNNVGFNSQGKGGNITVEAGSFSLQDGAQLQTITAGIGDAGNIKIIASGFVDINGTTGGVPSQISNIANEFAYGNAGNIIIWAESVSLRDGATLAGSSFGIGNGGDIEVTATKFVNISRGIIRTDVETLTPYGSRRGGYTAGDVRILSRSISLKNGAQITTSNFGGIRGGNVNLEAFTRNLVIILDADGIISSESLSGVGGNINVKGAELLLLRRGNISTNAYGIDRQMSNGGNININSNLIVALPGNNDITANANGGNGGRVNITSQGLFGIQYRPQGSSFTNDITASSTFGQSGNVQINTPGVDPGKDTGELPAAPNDASRQISQTCSASQRDNKFYITGRGGLPPNASEPQESEALWQDARAVKTKPVTTASQPQKFAPPAIGWIFQKDGRVRLVAAQTVGEPTDGSRIVCPKK